MGSYRLDTISDTNTWDQFVERSPQGTIFCETRFLKSLLTKYTLWSVRAGEELVCVTVILEDKDGNARSAPYLFSPYQGFVFKEFEKVRSYKTDEKQFEIAEFLIAELISRYKTVSLSHSPAYTDMRPFQWLHYNTPEKGLCRVTPRFTGYIPLSFNQEDDFLMSIKTSRRQEYKKKEEINISETHEIGILNTLHEMTFKRQGIERTDDESALVQSIAAAALENDFGSLTFAEYQGKPASAYLFIRDSKRAYFLFGANNPEFRSSTAATKLMIHNILETKHRFQINEIDIVGCNSPQRGYFKTSFNALVKPYFEIHYENILKE